MNTIGLIRDYQRDRNDWRLIELSRLIYAVERRMRHRIDEIIVEEFRRGQA